MKRNPLKFEYDREVDAAYLRIRRAKIAGSEEVEPGLIVDLDQRQQIVGVEILHFARRFMQQPKRLKKIAG